MKKKSFILLITLMVFVLSFNTAVQAVEPGVQSQGNGTIHPYKMTVQAFKGLESTDLYISVFPSTSEYSFPNELKKVQVKLFGENGKHILTENFFNVPLDKGLGIISLNNNIDCQSLMVTSSLHTNQSVNQKILREDNVPVLLKHDLFIETVDAPQMVSINEKFNVSVIVRKISEIPEGNFRLVILEDNNIIASLDGTTTFAGDTLTSSFNLSFKNPGSHTLKARITQVAPGNDDITKDEVSFGIFANKLSAPEVVSIEAADNGNGPGINAGDTITIRFNTETNQPPAALKSEIDSLLDFGLEKSLGSNYSGIWLDKQTLVVTVLDAAGSNISVGDVITIKADGNLTNADHTSENCSSSYAISGTFGDNKTIVVNFKDPALENSVRAALGLAQGDITNTDMTRLTRLIASYRQIKDLSGLEHAINLNLLHLSNNQITDITPLKNLKKLNTVYLDSNMIQDISGLISLNNLETLGISQNLISDISPLMNLTILRYLDANSNQISDISYLKDLINLEELNLSNNMINHVSALERLEYLTCLNLSYNNISTADSLSNLINLVSLSIKNNECIDLEPVKGLTNLEYLSFSNNKIADTSFLSQLTNLTELYMDSNNINEISSLSGLTRLQVLDASKNTFSDISALEKLINLNTLRLNFTQTSNTASLQYLDSLRSLSISNSEISDISGLNKLTNLYTLVISNNKISDISSLEYLTNLRWVDISNNQIADISSLVKNSDNNGIGQGDYVNLSYNRLNLTNGYKDVQDIEALINKGAIVNYIPQLPQ